MEQSSPSAEYQGEVFEEDTKLEDTDTNLPQYGSEEFEPASPSPTYQSDFEDIPVVDNANHEVDTAIQEDTDIKHHEFAEESHVDADSTASGIIAGNSVASNEFETNMSQENGSMASPDENSTASPLPTDLPFETNSDHVQDEGSLQESASEAFQDNNSTAKESIANGSQFGTHSSSNHSSQPLEGSQHSLKLDTPRDAESEHNASQLVDSDDDQVMSPETQMDSPSSTIIQSPTVEKPIDSDVSDGESVAQASPTGLASPNVPEELDDEETKDEAMDSGYDQSTFEMISPIPKNEAANFTKPDKQQQSNDAPRAEPSVESNKIKQLESTIASLRADISKKDKEIARRDDQFENLNNLMAENSGSDTIKAMSKYCDTLTKQLIEQAEKNLELEDKYCRAKVDLESEQGNNGSLREYLVNQIAGDDGDVEKYQNISLENLFRIQLQTSRYANPCTTQTIIHEAGVRKRQSTVIAKRSTSSADDQSLPMEGIASAMEAEISILKSRVRQLQSRLQEAEDAKQFAEGAVETVNQLKTKNTELIKRFWDEKESKKRIRSDLRKAGDRIKALSEHIEKLMVHLRHEAASKVKIMEQSRKTDREIAYLRDRNNTLVQKARYREQSLRELREGSKLLEDQLRLMDDKYVELRTKLDWTRTMSSKELKKVKTEANKLRAKFALAVGNNPELFHEIESLTKGKAKKGKYGKSKKVLRPGTSPGLNVQPQGLLRSSDTAMNHQQSTAGLISVPETSTIVGSDGALPSIENLGIGLQSDESYQPRS